MAVGKYDGAVLGAILGVVLITPSISTWFVDFFDSIIPSAWRVFGSFSLTIFAVAAGALVGLIVDKTK